MVDVASSRPRHALPAFVRALRPHQWVKNLLVFVPIGYIYPSRTPRYQTFTIAVGVVWGVMMLAVIWLLGFLFLIDNLGYDITTLVAGLGIGGIAIALAAQTVLGDLFSYLVIFFDKPFEVGDFIIMDDKLGTVEYIGIKTTRIRTLGGEQLICSNSDLTNSRVHNYKRMQKRRVEFKLGVTYQTAWFMSHRIREAMREIALAIGAQNTRGCHGGLRPPAQGREQPSGPASGRQSAPNRGVAHAPAPSVTPAKCVSCAGTERRAWCSTSQLASRRRGETCDIRLRGRRFIEHRFRMTT